MSKPVNLNRVRKEKARAEKKARADENAALHGMTRAEKQRAKAEAARVARLHDGAKRGEE
ncbi:DUF4169 family protein [Oceanicola sp. D3]|uniref:DUF4169 family protein n=1 Tax=Oceanicola sp. D3 TaxID=2587163 RepID=UPI00111E30DF|nr:DUF4169 family protein [Oceanicola sp. D3]QDC09823.1 DUF4169 family protein [Oceanicola sp. D3]